MRVRVTWVVSPFLGTHGSATDGTSVLVLAEGSGCSKCSRPQALATPSLPVQASAGSEPRRAVRIYVDVQEAAPVLDLRGAYVGDFTFLTTWDR